MHVWKNLPISFFKIDRSTINNKTNLVIKRKYYVNVEKPKIFYKMLRN